MTNSRDEAPEQGISDQDLPEDLQPGEENPLAEPLGDDVSAEDLDMGGGKQAEESERADDEQLED